VSVRPAKARRFRSVIFDFDYTLADSSAGVIDCMNYALEGLGFPASSPDSIRAMIGISLSQTYRHLSGDSEGARFAEFEQLFIERGDQVMLDGVRIFDSVRPTVETLLSAGLSLGIVSTKYRRRIEAVLQRDGLTHAFAVIVGGEDVVAHKPDPISLNTALARLHRDPSEVLYVGDSVVDAETAQGAGVPFVGVLSGVTSREALSAYRPLAILADLNGVPEVAL
jgi:phosphoglycolate phosphatase